MRKRISIVASVISLILCICLLPTFAQKNSARKSDPNSQKKTTAQPNQDIDQHNTYPQGKETKETLAPGKKPVSFSPPVTKSSGRLTPLRQQAERMHVSVPLREMPRSTRKATIESGDQFGLGKPEVREVPNPILRDGGLMRPHQDPALVDVNTRAPQIPAPILDFESISNIDNGNEYNFRVLPSDSNGDVGPNHYVAMVNLMMEVYDKTGASVLGPLRVSDFWNGLGGVCDTNDNGDPVVLYDQLADRWMISQFGLIGPPFHQCIAISQTGDPTGAYYQYDFLMLNNKINDYPHFGVWPDGYYMTDHQFEPGFVGSGVFAYDRAKMLAGDPTASFIYFDLNDFDPAIGGHLAADADGMVPPAPGSPEIFMMFTADEFGDPFDGLRIFEFHADFATPSNSTFTEIAQSPIHVASFNPISPAGRVDIPQPPPATAAHNLDSIQDRFMHRLQYRNFGSYETFAVTHTVDVDPTAAYRAGVRVYEFRRQAGSYFVEKQLSLTGTDTLHRWMGSAAIDGSGNLAVGYSVSNTATFPSIRYSAIANNGLFLGENQIIAGGGSQTSTAARWGDYSALSVDPVNDCNFWYINQYYVVSNELCPAVASTACWHNRVGVFTTDPGFCTAPTTGTLNGQVTDAVTAFGILGARVVATNVTTAAEFEVAADGAGNYSRILPPGDYSLVGKALHYQDSAPVVVTVTGGGTTTQNIALNGLPALVFESATVDDSATGNNNGVLDFNECGAVNVTLRNVGFADATNVVGTLSSASSGVTVPVAGATQSYGTILAQSSGAQGFDVSISPVFVCNNPIDLVLDVTSDQGSYSFPVSLSSASLRRDSIDVPAPVYDATGAFATDSIVTVSGVPAPAAIGRIVVSMHVTHTWAGDLDVNLIGPDGLTQIILTSDNGGSGDNYGTGCGNRTVFDDTAATSIIGSAAPFAGSFIPEQPLSTFSALADYNGTWTLRLDDDAAGDAGIVRCWSITFIPLGACTDGNGVCPGSVPILNFVSSAVSNDTNADGDIDTNDCFDLNVDVTNVGTLTATSVNSTLTTSTPGVTILQDTSAYPDVAAGGTETSSTPFQLRTSLNYDCTQNIDLTLNVTTADGNFSLPVTLVPDSLSDPQPFSATGPVPIPDNNPAGADLPLAVSGVIGNVAEVTANVRLTHTFDGDLDLFLIAPDGLTTVQLTNNNGGSGDNFGTDCPADGNDTTFDDAAASSISAGTAPFVGTFRPIQPLSTFNGMDPNGTWTLHAVDAANLDVGNIECWTLNVITTECQNAGCIVCGTITLSPPTLPGGQVGSAYNQTITASGGAAPYTFSVTSGSLPNGLTLNTNTGAITGTPTVDGTFNFEITATDSVECTGSQAYTIVVLPACTAITLSPSTLPDGQVGAAYSQTVTASGGFPGYTYSVSSGALPNGLTLNAGTGEISGTPTLDGTFNFEITATDSIGCTGSQAYSIVILPACTAITLSPSTLPDGQDTVAYSQTVTASGGFPGYTYSVSSGALPNGLSLNSGTGEISGTPTLVGSFNFDITATDSIGCTGSQAYTINVVAACLFCDDFNDGVLDPNWTIVKPTWSEDGAHLVGTATKKAITVAQPAFAGCQVCSFEASMQTAGGVGNKMSLYGWYVDKNNLVELLLKEESDKVVLKQKIGGTTVKKQSAPATINVNTFHDVKMEFDGSNITVTIDGTPVMTFAPAGAIPTGTVGFVVKGTVGTIDSVSVN